LVNAISTGLYLFSTGCAAPHEKLAGLRSIPSVESTPAAENANRQPLWWKASGDPVMAEMIEQGFATNAELVCGAVSLQAHEQQEEDSARKLVNRIARLFDSTAQTAGEAAGRARAYRYADRKARVAADIAAAYVEVRRLQETYALRAALLDQFKDNAEIAGFRREAGLVPGLDSGLAGSLVSVNASDLDAMRQQIAAAVRELARLTGLSQETLEARLGESGQVPDIAAAVSDASPVTAIHRADLLALSNSLLADMIRKKVSQEELDAVLAGNSTEQGEDSYIASAVARYRQAQADATAEIGQRREAVSAAAARQADLESSSRDARATVKDARLAYRSGTGNFATLYVAEAAALAVNEARIRARAALAVASIRLWTAQGAGWSEADLAVPSGLGVLPEVTVCE
jgi:outer membrane protein TolC